MTLDEATVLIIYPSPSWRDRSALLPRLVGYIGNILPLGVKRIPRMYPFFGRSTRNFREIDTGERAKRDASSMCGWSRRLGGCWGI